MNQGDEVSIEGPGNVKRKLKFPARICGGRDTLLRLANEILRAVNDPTFGFGWVDLDVRESLPSKGSNPPREWES